MLTKNKGESVKLDWDYFQRDEAVIDGFKIYGKRESQPIAAPFEVKISGKSERSALIPWPVQDVFTYWICAYKGAQEASKSNSIEVAFVGDQNPGNLPPPIQTDIPPVTNLRAS